MAAPREEGVGNERRFIPEALYYRQEAILSTILEHGSVARKAPPATVRNALAELYSVRKDRGSLFPTPALEEFFIEHATPEFWERTPKDIRNGPDPFSEWLPILSRACRAAKRCDRRFAAGCALAAALVSGNCEDQMELIGRSLCVDGVVMFRSTLRHGRNVKLVLMRSDEPIRRALGYLTLALARKWGNNSRLKMCIPPSFTNVVLGHFPWLYLRGALEFREDRRHNTSIREVNESFVRMISTCMKDRDAALASTLAQTDEYVDIQDILLHLFGDLRIFPVRGIADPTFLEHLEWFGQQCPSSGAMIEFYVEEGTLHDMLAIINSCPSVVMCDMLDYPASMVYTRELSSAILGTRTRHTEGLKSLLGDMNILIPDVDDVVLDYHDEQIARRLREAESLDRRKRARLCD